MEDTELLGLSQDRTFAKFGEMRRTVNFAFDIGHSSIGWAAIQPGTVSPEVLGCGVVTFRPDDCQSHQRAAFRRTRRNIAARRNRIKRLENLLLHVGALSETEVEKARLTPHPFPWLLAAKVLTGNRESLSWPELWAVVRWYAHNRGYDGNALWSGPDDAEDEEDNAKVENANRLMKTYGTATMAETVCSFLGVDPSRPSNPALEAYFKGEDAAFPRPVVIGEARRILEAHVGKISNCSEELVEAICGSKHES